MSVATDLPDVLAVAKLSPLLVPHLQNAFRFHDRLHESDPAAFEALAPRIRAIAASGESRLGAALMDRLPALEIVSVMGVGYDGIDVAAAKARGVVVTHTPDVLNDDVADLALGLMLSAARQLPAADRYVRAGQWTKGPMPLARKMSGARLGLVGIGRIGQAIAQRAVAFGMSVAYTARSPRNGLAYRYLPNAVELARESDFLVVITPGGAATRHLIDAKVLAALGRDGILVNVARGSVVDEGALIDALEQGVIAGAGLDVFEAEPNVPERLRALAHVVLAPHIGSATGQTRQAMADRAFANLRAHFDRQPLPSVVPECQ
ncbi:MAG: 2-hydroxyacid dehydrogenase [Burkholderiaceae bacterium]